MTELISVAGGVLVAVVLWDVFHTLWHPNGQGSISGLLIRGVWWAARGGSAHVRELAGPAALVVVIGSWLGLVLIGGALVTGRTCRAHSATAPASRPPVAPS